MKNSPAMMADLKFATRTLAKSPGFALVAIAMLALGIGASTACFSFLNAFFLRPPPFERPRELVSLHNTDERTPGLMRLSLPNLADYRTQNTVFTGLAVHTFTGARLKENGQNTDIFGQLVSANFFEVLGVHAELGRGLVSADDQEGAPLVIVVSDAFWRSRMGADPAAVGRTLLLNNIPFTLVGVAPAGFRGVSLIDAPEFWVAMPASSAIFGNGNTDFMRSRRSVSFSAVARLKPGVTLAQADLALKPITKHLAETYPTDNAGRSHRLIPVSEAMIDPNLRIDMVRAGNLLMALSGLILLIACANLANLLLARAGAREREVALRVALGARRGQIIRQLLMESLLLATIGGALGIGLAYWLRDLLWVLRPRGFPDTFAVAMDGGVLAFAVAATLGTGLLFGLVPALSGSRVDLVAVLKRAAKEGGVPLFSFRNVLVAAQVALSVVALVVAGLFLRSLQRANTVNLGWNSREIALISAAVSREGYNNARALEYFQRALERLRAVPGVIDATFSSRPFLTGVNPQRTIRPQGEDEAMRTRGQFMSYASVIPGFFRFMGIDLVAGRDFVAEDDDKRPPVVIINESLARRAWPGQDAIGKYLKLYNDEALVQVVGVVRDVRDVEIKAGPAPFAFFPLRQQFTGANVLHVRVDGSASALMPTLRKELQALDPAVTFYGLVTYGDLIRRGLWGQRTGAMLMTTFGLIALTLASLGIYAVMAHAVGQRTREIGIRIAIGAQARAVLALVLKRGVIVAGAGVLIGLGASLALTRYIRMFLFEIDPTDPLTFAVIALLLGAVALLACYVPARRATKVDPLIALRTE